MSIMDATPAECDRLHTEALRHAEQAVACMKQGEWSKAEAMLQLAAEQIDDAGSSADDEAKERPPGLGFLSLRKFARLVMILLRAESDSERVVIGTYGPSPAGEGRPPIFHDLRLNLTVGDFRRWAPDHVRETCELGETIRAVK